MYDKLVNQTKMSKKKFKQKKKKNKDFSRDILVILQKNSSKSFSWKQIAEKLKATSTEMRNDIIASLAKLVKQSHINETSFKHKVLLIITKEWWIWLPMVMPTWYVRT